MVSETEPISSPAHKAHTYRTPPVRPKRLINQMKETEPRDMRNAKRDPLAKTIKFMHRKYKRNRTLK